MTNAEKYTTARERTEAFHKFCLANTNQMGMCSSHCKLFFALNECDVFCGHCEFFWLEMDAREDEYRVCNGCGKRVTRDNGFVDKLVVEEGKMVRGDICNECSKDRYKLSFDMDMREYKFTRIKSRD